MNVLTKKLLPLFLLLLLLLSGCGGGKNSGTPTNETGGNSWITADTTPPVLSAPTVRTNGSDNWQDEIIYFVMIDRFCDGDSSNNGSFCNNGNINYYHGGDLQGIENQVNYIRNLGATAIWITPVVENVWVDPNYSTYTGYHGYWARDFTKLDPHLGSSNSFYQSFINVMHSNGLLVIQDIVLNHMGPLVAYINGWTPSYNYSGYTRKFAQDISFANASNYNYTIPNESPFNNTSAYHNYGQITNYNDTTQLIMGDLGDLPDLNTENSDVKDELIHAYGTWASLGVDGFRIDTARNVNEDFRNMFCSSLRGKISGKNFFQFGEVWVGYHPTLAGYVNSDSGMDSVLNYDLYYVMRTVFAGAIDSYHTSATHELTQELERRNSYSRGVISNGGNISAADGLVNFIDNHDNNRFLTDAGGKLDRLWLALTYLMTTKGIPCIYYNTENNITGTSTSGRKSMTNFSVTDKRTLTLLRVLSRIRTNNIALRRGTTTVLKDSTSGPGIFAFVGSTGTQSDNIFVLLNTSNQTINVTIDLSGYVSDKDSLTNILYKEFAKDDSITVNGTSITVSIPSYSMKIFKKL